MLRIGLVSDTHGLLRPEVAAFLRGCDHIVHGGDICEQAVITALESLAPVTAVRGNNDRGVWAGQRRAAALQPADFGRRAAGRRHPRVRAHRRVLKPAEDR